MELDHGAGDGSPCSRITSRLPVIRLIKKLM